MVVGKLPTDSGELFVKVQQNAIEWGSAAVSIALAPLTVTCQGQHIAGLLMRCG